jgi:hypothetical protein
LEVDVACGHCGFLGNLDEKGSCTVQNGTDPGRFGEGYEWSTVARTMVCPACRKLTFDVYDWADWLEPEEVAVRVLYPTELDQSTLPPSVRAEYDKAQRVKGIVEEFYAVGIRRTLEAICTDQGFPKTGRETLNHRLGRLARADRLPGVFEDMAMHLKDLGNLGAHPAGVAVEAEDVAVAADFVEAILDYLYRAPARVEQVKTRLATRTDSVRP